MDDRIWVATNKADEKLLRKKTREFDFSRFNQKEVNELILRMKRAMKVANGIGLSANQIGLDMRVFVAAVPASGGALKFYAIFNPTIEKEKGEKVSYEEGCLSVPGVYGSVDRPDRVILTGRDKHNKVVKIKAWGLLARVFQHEMDHLNGALFIDKAKELDKREKTGGSSGSK